MAQLTVRNLADDIVRALRVRAARHGRSTEAEHRLILAEALRSETSDFWVRADVCRQKSRKQRSDSAVLQREMRDSSRAAPSGAGIAGGEPWPARFSPRAVAGFSSPGLRLRLHRARPPAQYSAGDR